MVYFGYKVKKKQYVSGGVFLKYDISANSLTFVQNLEMWKY